MDFIVKYNLIKEAQKLLVESPQDLAHEITHHYRVWVLAQQISETVEQPFNKDVLELACWWHDVKIPNNVYQGEKVVHATAKYLSEKVDGSIKDCVYESIANHEYGDTPKTMEGKILQDADKLDLFSWDRTNLFIEAIRNGLYPKEIAKKKISMVFNEWAPVMIDKYHFEKSKEIHRTLEPDIPLIHKAFMEILSS